MELPQALEYLRMACKVDDASDAALEAEWKAARAKLGAAFPNAGLPAILPIPPAAMPYIAALSAQPHVAPMLAGPYAGTTFAMVEIDPLLAYQFSVDEVRQLHHHNGANTNVGLEELLELCLPMHWGLENVFQYRQQNSAMFVSHGLNFHAAQQGIMQTPVGLFVGIQAGVSIPWVHVTRFNGKCYLHNGFHRSVGARARGATHIPCILRDVMDHASAGVVGQGMTFDAALLDSANPPTVGHYTQGRAYDVTLKTFTRTINVSWSDYVVSQD